MEARETTRAYQCGAVLINPEKGRAAFADSFPRAGVDELFRRNRLWNALVGIDRKSREEWEEARRAANPAYREIAGKIDAVNLEIDAAYSRKRAARMKAGTRDADHPIIAEANREISRLKANRKKLWEEARPHRKEADRRIDRQALNDAFRDRVRAAQRKENTNGLNGPTANETARYFRVARSRTFDNTGSRLRFHPFDGTGFLLYRFRRPGETADGATFDEIARGEIIASETFRLEPAKPRRGHSVYRLRTKVAGGAKKASKVYAEFDLHLHRDIPKDAQINNAKLLRRRVGDRFRYFVSFSVRVPAAAPPLNPPWRAVGVDIGFKAWRDEYRVATIAIPTDDEAGWKCDHITLPGKIRRSKKQGKKRVGYGDLMGRVEEIQSLLDESAKELGDCIKPRLKGCEANSDEAHPVHKLVRKIVCAPSNVTLSYETAYKLGGKIRAARGSLPAEVEERTLIWRERWRKAYLEMHGLRRKSLGLRRETYRKVAAKLAAPGLPICFEDIDLSEWAEEKDKDNELSSKARRQRFMVAPSEFRDAVENAAKREGVHFIKAPAAYTSKTCSECGERNYELQNEVEWKCPKCGAEHDRDENAAKNIARAAVKKMAAKIREARGGENGKE